jgi:hypothetical protein
MDGEKYQNRSGVARSIAWQLTLRHAGYRLAERYTLSHDGNMPADIELLGIYLHLSRASQQRRQQIKRDRCLVLSATIAEKLGLNTIAAYCRKLILDHNPGHMVGHWSSIEDAMTNADFLNFVRIVQRRYPLERAEQMLLEMGISGEGERSAYYTDGEYAAALLGTNLDEIERQVEDSDPDG